MQKTLSTRIAERTGLKTPTRNAKNRASFLVLRPDIEQALNDGWPVKTIWETLHEEGKITFSYQAFRGYVNRLILSSNKGENTPPSIPSKPESEINNNTKQVLEPNKTTTKTTPGTLPGFTYNPVPNLEELF